MLVAIDRLQLSYDSVYTAREASRETTTRGMFGFRSSRQAELVKSLARTTTGRHINIYTVSSSPRMHRGRSEVLLCACSHARIEGLVPYRRVELVERVQESLRVGPGIDSIRLVPVR